MANARGDASQFDAMRRAVATRFLPALGYRDYRILWVASLLSGAAASGLIVARGWMVFTLSDSSTLVGVTTFAAMIPLLVVPPFVGLLADKLDRRTLLAGTFALNLGHNLLLAILALTGTMQVWHLVVLSLVNGIARAALMPTMQALVPNLVPRKLILNAVALNSATIHGSKLIGPGIVALLLTIAGPGSAFLACTGFYALGLVQVLRIRTASTGRLDPAKSALHNLLAGMTHVYQDRVLLALLVLVALHCALTMSFEAVLPVLSQQQFAAGGSVFGSLMMAVGGGALVSVLALAGVSNQRARGQLLLLTGFASSLSLLALAAAPTLELALLAAAGIGASQAAFMAITMAMMQALVPDAIRGRVTSIYAFHAGGVMAFANLLNGTLADVISSTLVLTISGGAFLLVMLVSFSNAILRDTYVRGPTAPVPAA